MRILVVDDDPDQRATVRALLDDAGLGPIDEATDGLDALERVGAAAPDLILLDLAMPRRSGLDVLPELKERAPEARVIIVSNLPRRRLYDVAVERGAVAYIEKRVAPEQLVAEILVAMAATEAAVAPLSTRLRVEPSSPREARALVRDALGADVGELLDAIELLVSELVTNAVVHASSAPVVEVHLSGAAVRVAVFDDDPRLPSPRVPDLDRPGGRGLHMVDQLATRWGSEAHGDGKVVWFELDRS